MIQNDLQANRPSNDARFRLRVMDGLTGLSNLDGLYTRLAEEIEISQAARQGFGLVLFDIDYFSTFNRARGHAAGDGLLAALAMQVRPVLQPVDFVARFGGDEVALVARRAAFAEVEQAAEQIRQMVAGSTYRLGDVLRPEARHARLDDPLPASPANDPYRQGLRHLASSALDAASAAFRQALQADPHHVPTIMELEYLKLRQTLDPAALAEPIQITVSGGAAWYRPGDTAKSLVERADHHLGQAKQHGRNRVQAETRAPAQSN